MPGMWMFSLAWSESQFFIFFFFKKKKDSVCYNAIQFSYHCLVNGYSLVYNLFAQFKVKVKVVFLRWLVMAPVFADFR